MNSKTIFTFENIYRAYLDCRKNKRKTASAIEFELNLDENIHSLKNELAGRAYYPGKSICFGVKYPCPREIFAANFRDRVVHHLLVREIIQKSEKMFFYNSFACRAGKGTHAAVETLTRYIKSITQNAKQDAYFLQLDLSNFFVSIKHEILLSLFKKLAAKHKKSDQWKREILWLAEIIIFHRPQDNCRIKGDKQILKQIPKRKSLFFAPQGSGLPIGNYSSQFFANLYLHELDYFAKQKLKAEFYIRYVDDFIFLSKSPSELAAYARRTEDFLQAKLQLSLNKQKIKLKKISQGIDFLGYFVKPSHTLVRKRVVNNCFKKINRYDQEIKSGLNSRRKLEASLNSYLGHFSHAYAYNLIKNLRNNLRPPGSTIF